MIKILLLEDEDAQREVLKVKLENRMFLVEEAANIETAAKKIEKKDFDVLILDLRLPDGHSIELLERFPEKLASKTVILTADSTVPSVVNAIQKGAVNYFEKPVRDDLLFAQVQKILEINNMRNQYQTLKSEVVPDFTFDNMIYESPRIKEMVERAKILAATDTSILIQGETGVGKEVFSRAIHNSSLRKGKTFLPVNCASIPDELFESELFGFEKGAFTGAMGDYNGRFVQADQGTLFLDEIGELPLQVQAKLLRVLDERVIYRLKSKTPQPINVRLVTATNKNLDEEVRQKHFRSDLLYRLRESSLYIPPLRERIEDILPLMRHYINVYNGVYNKSVTKIAPQAEEYFLNYPWRGNVRELKNTVKSIIPFKNNNTIEMNDISLSIIEDSDGENRNFQTLDEYEKDYIKKVLKVTGHNISRSAAILGISRPRLYHKIKEFKLEQKK
jgi:two-component system NtrC family response regulator